MKKIFAILLAVFVICSLCACSAPDSVVTANGETISNIQYGETLFEVDDQWTITKLAENIYYVSSVGTRYVYSMTITNGEYSCYVIVNQNLYTVLNVGDVIDGTAKQFLSASNNKIAGSFYLLNNEYDCSLYKNVTGEGVE